MSNVQHHLLWRMTLAAFCCVIFCASARGETYSVGIVPQFEARKLSRIWEPIMFELEARTGHDFVIVGSPRIPEFEADFLNGKFDFAYMNPYHYLLAARAQGYRPLVRDGARQLYGVLVVRADSRYQAPADLNGQVIAFPAPNALGASLMIRADLTNRHEVNYTPNYVATHGSAYLNVVLGQAAAAGGVMGTLRSQQAEVIDQLKVLYETSRVAPHPIVAHPRVPVEVQQQFAQALLDLSRSAEGRALLQEVPIQAAIRARVEDYTPLVLMGLDQFLVK